MGKITLCAIFNVNRAVCLIWLVRGIKRKILVSQLVALGGIQLMRLLSFRTQARAKLVSDHNLQRV